jgi:transcriptional regulator with XRE-family HTH domain
MKPTVDDYEKFNEAFNRSLGNDIKRIREEMDITQDEMAERLGIESRYMQKIESGNVSFKTHIKIMFQISVLNSSRQITSDYTQDHSTSVAKRLKKIITQLLG